MIAAGNANTSSTIFLIDIYRAFLLLQVFLCYFNKPMPCAELEQTELTVHFALCVCVCSFINPRVNFEWHAPLNLINYIQNISISEKQQQVEIDQMIVSWNEIVLLKREWKNGKKLTICSVLFIKEHFPFCSVPWFCNN